MNLDGWTAIIRTGVKRDRAGNPVQITRAQLDAMAADVADPTPVTLGKVELTSPAFAWVEAARRVGDRLEVRLRNISDELRRVVRSRGYQRREVSLKGARLNGIHFVGGVADRIGAEAAARFMASDPDVTTIVLSTAESDAGAREGREMAGGDASRLDAAAELAEASGMPFMEAVAALPVGNGLPLPKGFSMDEGRKRQHDRAVKHMLAQGTDYVTAMKAVT